MPIEEEPKWNRRVGLPPVDIDVSPAREGIYAGDLPSNVKDHTPRHDDFPRGWTVQQPWHHAQYPKPAVMRCTMCAQSHEIGHCVVMRALVALDTAR